MLIYTYHMSTFRFNNKEPISRHDKMIYLGKIAIKTYSQIVNHETVIPLAKCALQIKSHLFFGFFTSF